MSRLYGKLLTAVTEYCKHWDGFTSPSDTDTCIFQVLRHPSSTSLTPTSSPSTDGHSQNHGSRFPSRLTDSYR